MIEVREEGGEALDAYASVPIAFEVRARVRPEPSGTGTWRLREAPVTPTWRKDYDALDGGPQRWPERFDVSRWGWLGTFEDGRRVGGAAIAWDTPGLDMLEGRRERAVLWDLRVHPDARRRGVGRALFDRACAWARARACTELVVETQDVNVSACRFYAAMGCTLTSVEPGAYPELPDETKLLWRTPLTGEA